MKSRRAFYCSAGSFASAIVVSAVCAQQPAERIQFDIAPQPLKYALRNVTRASGLQLFAMSSDLAGKTSSGLHGQMSTQEALDQLLAGTDLTAQIEGGSVFIRGRPQAPASGQTSTAEIVVTGSRIAGVPTASPVIRLSQDDIRQAGQSSLGEAIRSIPQNFGGSQNPGAGLTVPEKNGTAVGAGSSIDLRGLGGDATLTLLDGHRLSYDAADQAVDVSVIPLAALDRIEIVADGASALYGSDAVAGVANIILKRDFSGLRTDARFGASSDGGNVQQMYDAVGGTRWSNGGFLAAYNFAHSTPIVARERSYAADSAPGLTLWPEITQNSAVLTGHQGLGSFAQFSFDGVYSDRTTAMSYGLSSALDLNLYHIDRYYHSKALSLAPSLQFDLGGSWSAKIEGVYGVDKSYYKVRFTLGGVPSLNQAGCYCNDVWNGEFSATGKIFQLPAGAARLALGGGYRSTGYHGYTTAGAPQDINVRQSTYYEFSEISLPVLHQLDLDAAARFEDYPGVARIVTPKIGAIYRLGRSIDIKASWGRSFKAPTFYERYSAQYADLYVPSALGGSGHAADATALVISGGNPDLKPERATTWSTTVSLHPVSIPNLHADISYFHVRYVDRIVAPITYLTQALSDPAYASYVNLAPTSAELATAIAGRTLLLHSTQAYDPSKVIALVSGENINATGQTAQGVDVSVSYNLPLRNSGNIRFSFDGNYLRSSQRLTSEQSLTKLAGTIFNPPHVRARGGIIWDRTATTLSAFVNYTGGVHDIRLGQGEQIGAMTTLDLAASYHSQGHGVLSGLDLSLSASNIFNAKPDKIPTTAIYETPYDSLNYSPAGRVISVAIGKKW